MNNFEHCFETGTPTSALPHQRRERYIPHLVITLLIAILFAFPASAQERLLDIQEVKSAGGVTAWLVEDHSVPVISMNFGFQDAGAKLDPMAKQGLARMVSNTLDEGAGDLDAQAFQKELLDLAISLGFSAGRDHFGGSLKTLSKNKARAFELLTLALTKPRFDEEAIVRMRQANESRIRSSLSNPDWKAARILNDKAFAGHPYAMNSGGTLSSLSQISAADLRAFQTTRLGRNNLIVSVAGDISAAELSSVLDQVFGSLPTVEIAQVADIAVQNGGQIFQHTQDIPQSVIEILQPGIGRGDPDYYTAQIMNFILGSSGFGSRLTEEVREKRGLVYGIYSYFYDMNHLKGLAVSTSTANDNVPEVLKIIRGEFEKLKKNRVKPVELADAKSYLVGSLPLSLTSTDKISGLMNSLQMDGLAVDYLDQRKALIEAVSAADIQALAKKLLVPDQFTTVIVGQPVGLDAKAVQMVTDLPNVE